MRSDPVKARAWQRRGAVKAARKRAGRRTAAERDAYEATWHARRSFAGGLCELKLSTCTQVATEPHHVYPQRSGVDDSFENLRASCSSCNAAVESVGVKSAEALGLYSPTPLGASEDDL